MDIFVWWVKYQRTEQLLLKYRIKSRVPRFPGENEGAHRWMNHVASYSECLGGILSIYGSNCVPGHHYGEHSQVWSLNSYNVANVRYKALHISDLLSKEGDANPVLTELQRGANIIFICNNA